MGEDQADITSSQLDNHDLACDTSREGNLSVRDAQNASKVVRSLVLVEQRATVEAVELNGVLEGDKYLAGNDLHSPDRCHSLYIGRASVLGGVPYDQLDGPGSLLDRKGLGCFTVLGELTRLPANLGRTPPPTRAMMLEMPIIWARPMPLMSSDVCVSPVHM